MPASSRIADAVATTRARASLAGSGPGLSYNQTRDLDHVVADAINITDVTLQRTVDPGEQIDALIEVETNAAPPVFQVGPVAPPDKCDPGFLSGPGWETRATLSVPGDSDSATICESSGKARAPKLIEYDLSVRAPDEPGDYDYEITIDGATTGDLMDFQFVPLTVRDPDRNDPDPDPDPSPDPEPPAPPDPEPPAPPDPPKLGLLERIIRFLENTIDRAITAIEDIVFGIRDLLIGIGETIYDALLRLAEWLGDNKFLVAAIATVALYIAPQAVDFAFANFTPIGWLERIASSVLP